MTLMNLHDILTSFDKRKLKKNCLAILTSLGEQTSFIVVVETGSSLPSVCFCVAAEMRPAARLQHEEETWAESYSRDGRFESRRQSLPVRWQQGEPEMVRSGGAKKSDPRSALTVIINSNNKRRPDDLV